jgi:hypothetical protein
VFPAGVFNAKKTLYAAMVKNLEKNPGIAGNDILLILHEPPMGNGGIRGDRPASEVGSGMEKANEAGNSRAVYFGWGAEAGITPAGKSPGRSCRGDSGDYPFPRT